jgi:hypothetical protein
VEKSGYDSGDISLQRCEHAGHGDKMLQVGFAGSPTLAFVRLGGKFIGSADHTEIGLGMITFQSIQQLVEVRDSFVDHKSLYHTLCRTSRIRS